MTAPASDIADPEQALIEDIASFQHDPLGHVMYVYPWGEGELEGKTGPRQWQRDVLVDIGNRLAANHIVDVWEAIRMATVSGHGPGKSTLVAWIVKWALDTFEDARVVVTANTEGQLRSKTWAEVAKWHRLAINQHWFKLSATALYSPDPRHEKTWRADAIPWSESNTEAFAGLHNEGRRIVLIFDEASAIDDAIWEVAEGALTDDLTEILWLAFGNGTRNTGRFKECFGRYRHRWITRHIDSRDVEGTNKALFDEWIADYGLDSDFVKVRVRGMFPAMAAAQFISTADVDPAFGRHLRAEQYNWAPKILTLDPAWEGDDKLVIGMRQGLYFQILRKMAKNDNDVQVANLLMRLEDELQADAVFIDGGYGTGIVSVGRTLGRDWQLVWFGEKATDSGYLNKRSEMWGAAKKWLKEGGAIPDDQELYDDLIGPETIARLDGKIALEAKKDMKRRGLPSPNCADALVLSFAYPVTERKTRRAPIVDLPDRRNNRSDWDPFADDRL